MATTIKLKNGSGAPLAGDLVQGEPALDLTNKRLYTEDSGGTVIEVGTNPTSLTTGTFTSTGIDDNATSTAITIDSSQRVGIGKSPSFALDVGVADTTLFRATNSNATGTFKIFHDSTLVSLGSVGGSTNELAFKTGGSTGTERMRIDSSGALMVGATSSTPASIDALLQLPGQIRYTRVTSGDACRFYSASTQVGSIFVGSTTTTYNTSSDVRLKENIVDAPAGNIDAIRVRSFDWKIDGSHQTYGMVAQELIDVAPEAVSQGETDDDIWGVDYSKLVPMMIKEIQDLRARVAQLEGA